MIAPKWDADFPTSKTHGLEVQRQMIREATSFCGNRCVAIDGGAHIGLTASVLAETFFLVYAFEPVQENYDCLKANVPENVMTCRTALGDEATSCALKVAPGANSGCWHVAGRGDIPMKTINSLNLFDVSFIKLDVEGFEGFALQGAIETLKEFKPVVLFEANGTGSTHFGARWIDPKTVLTEFGYKHRVRLPYKNEVWTCQ